MSSDDPRPGTTADAIHRLERVEEKVDKLETRMGTVEMNQQHARELQTLHFTTVFAKLDAIAATQAAVEARLNTKDVEAARAMSDPMATPAGQAVMGVVGTIVKDVAEIKRKVYYAGGAVGLVVFLAPILGPFVRSLLGLP